MASYGTRRHLNESQRAMVAAKLANMPSGERTDLEPSANLLKVSQSSAAEKLSVSTRSVTDAVKVREKAAPEIVARVERGDLAVSIAAKVADMPMDRQVRVSAMKSRAAARMRWFATMRCAEPYRRLTMWMK